MVIFIFLYICSAVWWITKIYLSKVTSIYTVYFPLVWCLLKLYILITILVCVTHSFCCGMWKMLPAGGGNVSVVLYVQQLVPLCLWELCVCTSCCADTPVSTLSLLLCLFLATLGVYHRMLNLNWLSSNILVHYRTFLKVIIYTQNILDFKY